MDNHAPTFYLAQNLKHTQSKSKGKFKMMLKKNDHVIFLKYSHEANMFFSLPTI